MIHNASVHETFFVESTRTYQIKTKVETDDEGSHTSGFGENPHNEANSFGTDSNFIISKLFFH